MVMGLEHMRPGLGNSENRSNLVAELGFIHLSLAVEVIDQHSEQADLRSGNAFNEVSWLIGHGCDVHNRRAGREGKIKR